MACVARNGIGRSNERLSRPLRGVVVTADGVSSRQVGDGAVRDALEGRPEPQDAERVHAVAVPVPTSLVSVDRPQTTVRSV